MPLKPSDVAREPLHTRSIRVQSYSRTDGLWDLEAELIDYKGYDFSTRDGGVFEAGRYVHHMHLRVTIDAEFTIQAACAFYDAAPYGDECTAIDEAYRGLAGLNLLKSFRNEVRARFGRTAGCTHLTELTNVLPTAAVQTMANQRRVVPNGDKQPFQLNGCHALRTDGPTALKYYPRWYTGPAGSTSLASGPRASVSDADATSDTIPPSVADAPCR